MKTTITLILCAALAHGDSLRGDRGGENENAHMCCQAMEAGCEACKRGVTLSAFCGSAEAAGVVVVGCPPPPDDSLPHTQQDDGEDRPPSCDDPGMCCPPGHQCVIPLGGENAKKYFCVAMGSMGPPPLAAPLTTPVKCEDGHAGPEWKTVLAKALRLARHENSQAGDERKWKHVMSELVDHAEHAAQRPPQPEEEQGPRHQGWLRIRLQPHPAPQPQAEEEYEYAGPPTLARVVASFFVNLLLVLVPLMCCVAWARAHRRLRAASRGDRMALPTHDTQRATERPVVISAVVVAAPEDAQDAGDSAEAKTVLVAVPN